MEQDEAGTFERLRTHRKELFEPEIAQHHGRIFKLVGDGLLAEFASVVGAVECAAVLQRGMARRHSGLPEGQRIEIRIGLHVGDVIVEDGDRHGDAVNVAARLQQLAEPGGICVSRPVVEHVKHKVPLDFELRGEERLKNVAEPVSVYRVNLESGQTKLLPPLPDKASIAVLPFENLSDDSEQQYFADGMVEEIITALSRMRWLFVIARDSSFTYKGRAVDVKQVGRELGVRYVLDGTVRKARDRVRISGQLIDASTGAHIWADHFDGALDDVFDLQDQVAASVVGAIEPKLKTAEIERVWRKPTESLDAYDLYLRALALSCYTREENLQAVQLLRKVLKLDPHFANAYGLAALCIFWQKAFGWISPSDPTIEEGIQMARTAADEARNEPEALWMAGGVLGLLGGDLEGGLALIERSLSLNPNSANACTYSSLLHAYLGDYESAIALGERSMRLSPHDPIGYHNIVAFAWAHFMVGRYEEAASWCDKALQIRASLPAAFRLKAAACGLLGRVTEAHHAVERLLTLSPSETLSSLKTYYEVPIKKPGRLEALLDGLRKAGLPE